MKKWFESKTVWLGILATLSGVMTLGAQYVEDGAFSSPEGVMLFAVGLVGIVVRVWFTDKAIEN